MAPGKKSLTDKPEFHIAFVIVLGFLAYSNTFGAPFVFDDDVFVNTAKRKSIGQILLMFVNPGGDWASRPLLHATLALNYNIGGLNTWGYHAVNLALHLINGILLYILVSITGRHLGHDDRDVGLAAAFSSLLFVLHPVQTEAVTYIISRSMLLSTAFYLSGLILFHKAVVSDKKKGFYLAGLFVAALLGVSSRENFAVFPITLFLYDMFFLTGFRPKAIFKNWRAYAPVLLAFAYFAYIALNHSYKKYGGYGKGLPPLDYVLTQFSVHWTYLRLLALPVNQTIDYDYRIARSLFEFRTLAAAAGYAAILGTAVLYAKRKPFVSFGILSFLIALTPVSFIVALMKVSLGDVIFEHRLYLPSAGLIVLASASIVRLSKSRPFGKLVIPATVIVTIALGAATYARNAVWSDGIRLWSDVIEKAPRKARGYNNVAPYYRERGQTETAIEFLNRALAIDPGIAKTHYNLGNAYSSINQFELATEHYLRAIDLEPSLVSAHVNLGILYKKTGQLDKAVEQYEEAVRLGPDSPEPYFNLANAYMQQGRFEEAIALYEKAIAIRPGEPGFHNNLAIAYSQNGLHEKAQEQLSIAERLKEKRK